MAVTVGHIHRWRAMAWAWIWARSISTRTICATVFTVVCCVASRNKRAHRAFCWQPLPYFGLTLVGRTPGRNSNSRRASGVLRAARGQASGPRDPQGSQEQSSQSPPQFCRVQPVALFSGVRPRRASLSPRTEIPNGIALLALSSSGRSLRGLG